MASLPIALPAAAAVSPQLLDFVAGTSESAAASVAITIVSPEAAAADPQAAAAAAAPAAAASSDPFAAFSSTDAAPSVTAQAFARHDNNKNKTKTSHSDSKDKEGEGKKSRKKSSSSSKSRSRSRASRSRSPLPGVAASSANSAGSSSPAAAARSSSSSLSASSSFSSDLSACSSDSFSQPSAAPFSASSSRGGNSSSGDSIDRTPWAKKPVPPPAARYNTFGETDRVTGGGGGGGGSRRARRHEDDAVARARALLEHSDSLPTWLHAHGFDSSVVDRLAAAGASSVPHALRLTKAGLKQMLGVRDGLRVHLALREAELAQDVLEEAAAAAVEGDSDRRSSRQQQQQRPKLSASSYLPSYAHHSSYPSSSSPAAAAAEHGHDLGAGSLLRELHPAGMYGYCAVADCDLAAPVQCAIKTCGKGLCNFHAHKMLLTGSTVCEACYNQIGYMDNVKEAVGINALHDQGYLDQIEQCTIQ